MIEFFKTLVKSFLFAMEGIVFFVKNERNAKIHLIAAITVLLMSYYYKVNSTELISILLAIALVLVAEAINTSIEKLSDTVTLSYSEEIKKVKDVAAGAVLIASIFALIIGLIIFGPKVLVFRY